MIEFAADQLYSGRTIQPGGLDCMRYFSKIYQRLFGFGICRNVNDSRFTKECLLIYVAGPFLTKNVELGHQSQWQAVELAKIIGEFGFNVDVINFGENVRLTKQYDLIVDLHPGMNKCYLDHMKPGCRTIAYITGSNPSFANQAEQQRLHDLQVRRGGRLQSRRQTKVFEKERMASLDAMFFIGNSFNLRTYDEFSIRKVCHITNTGHLFLHSSDFSQKSPTSFLFLASGGQVHKGLDLLLEVFSENSHLHLFVCSAFKEETDFCDLYGKELFKTDNIHPVGFIDIRTPLFESICRRCSYVLLPSCSEANAGSILTAMSAGLIPIVSRECGFEADEVIYFDDCSIESIRAKVVTAAGAQPEWIRSNSERAMEIVATRYSQERYSASVRSALKEVLA